jgi:hypothetical protein
MRVGGAMPGFFGWLLRFPYLQRRCRRHNGNASARRAISATLAVLPSPTPDHTLVPTDFGRVADDGMQESQKPRSLQLQL